MSDSPDTVLTGGCHCGALRYRVTGPLLDNGYCHCRICQLTTGAPVLAWTSVPVGAFAFERGEPTRYRSSDWGERLFCATCGTQVLYREIRDPATVEINVGSLDRPEAAAPAVHIHTASRTAWFETDDNLPRYPGGEPPKA